MSDTVASPALPRAVVFDIGRVLVEWDLRLLFAKLIEDRSELDWFLAHVVTEAWHAEHDAGRDLRDLLEERKRAYPRYASLIDAYATRFSESIPGPVPGTAAVVRALAGRGVPLYAITNFAAAFWPDFRAGEPLLDLFGDIVVSGVEKIAKPDPRIFALAAKRFGHAPEAMLFIDDNAENVASAAALGWATHRFIDAATLSRDPRIVGLLIR